MYKNISSKIQQLYSDNQETVIVVLYNEATVYNRKDIIMGNYFTPYSLRIDEELKEKVKFIAKKNRRTLNMEITVACEEYVGKYENEYGKIEVTDF